MPTPPSPMPNDKQFSCSMCDHFHPINYDNDTGECHAHTPGYCEDDPTGAERWPLITGRALIWCDEFKKATFALPPAANNNPHNPTNDTAGLCCLTCDHFQPTNMNPQSPNEGLCLAHKPAASCTELVASRQANCFPMTNRGTKAWCSEWKRRATEEPAGRPT